MTDNELALYPHGQIGMGTGNLKQATLGRFSITNGATLRHTLAKSPSGVTLGPIDLSGSIEFEVPEQGLEREVVRDVQVGQRRQIRFKDATATYEIIGMMSQADVEFGGRQAVRVTANFVGKLVLK